MHPLAWWAWAACLAVTAMQTTDPNPFLLLLVGAVACFVVASCRGNGPWSQSLGLFLRIGLVVIVIRVVIEILFGQRGVPGHVLFILPHVPLPSWAAAVSIGGAVTLESIITALVLGLQLAVILVCFGSANSMVSPYRLLRCLPAVLYEAGVAVTVALSFTPELIETIAAVREARRLRGIPTNGLRGLRGVAVPVLEGALDRSLQLATSMDARGYGRRNDTSGTTRALAVGATGAGLLLAAIGVYGVIDAGSLFGLGSADHGRRRRPLRGRADRGWPAHAAEPLPARSVGRPGVGRARFRAGRGGVDGLGQRPRCARRDRFLRPTGRSAAPSAAGGRDPGRGAAGLRRAGPPRRPCRDPRRTRCGPGMIRFDEVSFRYAGAARPTLDDVTLEIPEGELCVVIGETGSGKSTLLRSVNGLVPHFSGGTFGGTVTVDGRSTRQHRPRELADVVGYVGQNPLASFVTERVEDELAYTMENLGVAPDAMRRRVEDTVDLLGLHDLRDRSLRALSGGQQQRVAIGAVLTASPRVSGARRAHVRPRPRRGRGGPRTRWRGSSTISA